MSRALKTILLAATASLAAAAPAQAQDAETDPRFQPRIYGEIGSSTIQTQTPVVVQENASIVYRTAIPASNTAAQTISDDDKVRIYQSEINGYSYAPAPVIVTETPAQTYPAQEYPMAKTYSSVEAAHNAQPIQIELYQDVPATVQASTTTGYYNQPATAYEPVTYGASTYNGTTYAGAVTHAQSTSQTFATVVAGQGIWRVAKNNCTTVSELRAANSLIAGQENLQPGQELIVPNGGCNASGSNIVFSTMTPDAGIVSNGQTTFVRNTNPLPNLTIDTYAVLPRQGIQAIGRETCRDWRQIAAMNGLTASNKYALQRDQILRLPAQPIEGCVPQ